MTTQGKSVEDRERLISLLSESLIEMVAQHCTSGAAGKLDSMSLSANARAMRLLASLGHLKVTAEYGRRVMAEWNDTEARP